MLKRRDIIVLPVIAGATYVVGTLASRQEVAVVEKVPGTMGPMVVEEAFLSSLRRTVSNKVDANRIADFVALARRDFEWVFHPLTKIDDFDRKLCTEFLLNSNLTDNGYDIESYEFRKLPEACQPFLVAET